MRSAAILMAFSLAGCVAFPCHKTPRVRIPLREGEIAAGAEQLKKGDVVHTMTQNGALDEFEIVTVEPAGFVGVAWDHKSYRVSYRNLKGLWVERPKWTICVQSLT